VGTSLAAEQLLALAVTVTSEQRVDSVLQSIVQGLASQPGVALARIWLLPSADLPSFYHAVSNPADYLCLVASAGTPINSPGEDWCFLQGHFARVPFNVGKVGQVAASRHPILVEDVATQNDWVVRPEWAKREEIRSFAGHPLIFRDKLLGVIGVFSRQRLGQQEFTWLGLFANQAAVSIANACAEEALRSSERNLAAIINTIPTGAWTTRPDGYRDFINQVWLDYAGMTAENAQGWGWAEAIHPDDRQRLVDVWQSSLASGTPVDTETRIRRFDGSYRWFLTRANPLRDESGKILKWYGTNIDIEDRKQGEEALRAREMSWRQIVDNIPGLVAKTGAMGEVEFLNRQTLEYFGKTNEELKNWALIDVVHPDDLPRVIEARKKSLEEGQIYDVEHRGRRADGVYRWFQVRGLPVRDGENKITAWYLLLIDIDDRKKAEQALQSSERNLSLIINAIPALIHTARPDGYLDYFNRRWLEYLGCSLSDVEGWKWTTWIHPDDSQGIIDKWRACLASGEIFEHETRVRRGDGQYRWMFHRKVPLRDEHGNIVRWYGTSLDIEDRKRAEAQVEQAYLRLAEAQRLSKTGSFITDLLADDHNWSEEAFRIFEFDPSTKVTVQRIRDMVHPEDLASFDAVIARGMTGNDVDFVFRVVTSRRGVKHIRGMARFIEQVAGRPLFIGALQDVTESKIAEEALNRARSELAHVARLTTLNTLTASIAHEVNQPLSGIIMNASTCMRMLATDPPNVQGARETARRTIRDCKRASDVISRLRTLYSKKEFTLEQVDLNEATREVVALSLSDLQRNRVILRSELADDLPPVTGDRVQLQQVILNLLRNASDAMSTVDDRPRQLLIRTEREEADRVCLSVKDVGLGITREAADKLFQPFYTTKRDGMGIGLSVSHSIIDAHHGRLWGTANDGPGATFSFAIPCRREDVETPGDRPDAVTNAA
jgi:PAS domain S-box-containing protein